MIFRQLFDHQSSTYTYLLADGESRKAILIDPVKEHCQTYIQLLSEMESTLHSAIDTHVHADHITALGELREITGCETIVGKQAGLPCASRHIADGDTITLGQIKLTAIYTPGHTDDSYCFYTDYEQGYLFSGDTLLIRGTGRTDFQSGSNEALYNSLFNRLLTLPDQTRVCPGHDYKGWTQSTIGEERRNNPRLQVNSWEQLANILDNLNLQAPHQIKTALPANRKCGQLT